MITLLKIIFLIIVIGRISNCLPDNYEEAIELAKIYFKTKEISQITFISCSQSNSEFRKIFHFKKKFNFNGFQTKVLQNDFELTENGFKKKSHGILSEIGCKVNFLDQRFYKKNIYWFFMDLKPSRSSLNNFFNPANTLIDSEVVILQKNPINWNLLEIYKIKENHPVKINPLIASVETNSFEQNILQLKTTGNRRKNFEKIYLRCATVILYPETFTSFDDVRSAHIDTYSKLNYPIVTNLKDDLNFTFDLLQVDSFGWPRNGTFDGLLGLIQRKEIEFGATGCFMRNERMNFTDYIAETVKFHQSIIFRQPPLSSVTNIFTLPFNFYVWMACIATTILSIIAIIIQRVLPNVRNQIENMDSLTMALGIFCQQGFHISLKSWSGKMLTIIFFTASLFLFTSYSANIVALLQSSSHAINTIPQLIKSPLKVFVQKTVYNRAWFEETKDEFLNELYMKKIKPHGSAEFIDEIHGIKYVQTGLYAFQVEAHAGYKIISDTFEEYQKCGIKELEAFRLPIIAIPIKKNSAFKEIFKERICWQREVGLINREGLKWVAQKPKCTDKMGAFVSVGLDEFKPALIILGFGMCLSMVLLVFEIIVSCILKLKKN